MSEQQASPQPSQWLNRRPGDPVLSGVNWGGLKTLYIKEVRRFFKVQMQTVWAPAITTLLYLVIFTVALGRSGRTVLGVPPFLLGQFVSHCLKTLWHLLPGAPNPVRQAMNASHAFGLIVGYQRRTEPS